MQAELEKLDKEAEAQRIQRDTKAEQLTQSIAEFLSKSPDTKQHNWAILDDEVKKTVSEWLLWKRVRKASPGKLSSEGSLVDNKTWQIIWLWRNLPPHSQLDISTFKSGLPFGWSDMSTMLYFSALCLDFEGSERSEFLDFALVALSPVRMEAWFLGLSFIYPFEKYLKGFMSRLKAQDSQIHLDVTNATLDDVVARWDDVEAMQKRMGVTVGPRRGRRKGSWVRKTEERDQRICTEYETMQKGKQDRLQTVADKEHMPLETVRSIIIRHGRRNRCRKELTPVLETQLRIAELMGLLAIGRLTPEQTEQLKTTMEEVDTAWTSAIVAAKGKQS